MGVRARVSLREIVIRPPLPASALPAKVLQQPNVSLALANELIGAALAACHADGRSAVAVVVDRGGNLVAVPRGDSVGPHNTAASQRKAFTALSTKTATRLFAERARSNPETANLNTLDELLLLGGGIPLFAADELVGAMGVAGSGGGEQDENCAIKAAEKTGLATTRSQ